MLLIQNTVVDTDGQKQEYLLVFERSAGQDSIESPRPSRPCATEPRTLSACDRIDLQANLAKVNAKNPTLFLLRSKISLRSIARVLCVPIVSLKSPLSFTIARVSV